MAPKSLKSRLQKAAFSSRASQNTSLPSKNLSRKALSASSMLDPTQSSTQFKAIVNKKVQFAIFVKDDEPNSAEEITFSIGQDTEYEELASKISTAFNYTRPPIIKTMKNEKFLASTTDLKNVCKDWSDGAPDRRKITLQQLIDGIIGVLKEPMPSPAETPFIAKKVLNINRIFELAQRQANISAINSDELLHYVVEHLRCQDFAIGSAAARLVWKIISDNFMCQKVLALTCREGNPIAVILLNNLMKRTKNVQEQEFVNDDYYYHNVGALLTLSHFSEFVSSLLIDHASVLFQICTLGDHIETKRAAAEGLCILLANSRKARKTLAKTGNLGSLSSLVNVNNTYVVMCACAAMCTFSKTKVDRDLIDARDAEPMFHAVLDTCMWCLSELTATAELQRAAESSNTQIRGDNLLHDIVTNILEHAASAAWGLSIVIAREKHYDHLLGDLKWVSKLKNLLFCGDHRIDDCVKIAISGTFSVLAFDLNVEMSEYEDTLSQMLNFTVKNVKTSDPSHTCRSLLENLNYLTYARTEKMWEIFTYSETGPDIVLDIMKPNITNNDVMKPLSSSLLYITADMHSTWSEERLKFVTRILAKNKNQMVLNYVTSSLWCLARDETNRRTLGKLFCIQGLLKLLKGNSDLALKERLVGTLWLLCCDEKNAVIFAMSGGIDVLNACLNFDNSHPYLNLKTLCVCLLFKIQEQPDIFALIRSVDMESVCVDMLKCELLTPYLHVQLAGFVYYMSQHKDCRKKFIDIAGEKYLEELFTDMVFRENSEVQILGVYGVSLLAMNVKSKKFFGSLNVVKGLAAILNDENGKYNDGDKVKVLHAILNLSQEARNQILICHATLPQLIDLARNKTNGLLAEFSTSILTNMSNNGECRSEMYKLHLKQCSTALETWHKDVNTLPSITAAVKATGNGMDADDREREYEDEEGDVRDDSKREEKTNSKNEGDDAHEPTLSEQLAFEAAQEERNAQEIIALGKIKRCLDRPVTTLWEEGAINLLPKISSKEDRKNQNQLSVLSTSLLSNTTPENNLLGSKTPKAKPLRSSISHNPLQSTYARRQSLDFGEAGGDASDKATKRSNRTANVLATESAVEGENEYADALDGDPLQPSRVVNMNDLEVMTGGDRPMTAITFSELKKQQTLTGRNAVNNHRPLSPLRSSHRVGPVGRLGSSNSIEGENRWRPPICSYKKPDPVVDPDDPASAFTQKSKYLISLQPPTAYNKITFETNKHLQKDKGNIMLNKSPVSLVMWKKVPGSSIGHGLYDHFVSPEGETLFFYHKSSIVCESLQPEEYPRPGEPVNLFNILQTDFIPPAHPAHPSNEKKPLAYVPALPHCPLIEKHYIPLCSLAAKASLKMLKPSLELLRRANMFGAVPSEPLRLVSYMEEEERPESESEEEEEDASEATVEEEEVEVEWTLGASKVFGKRAKASDSKDFYDTLEVVESALGADFNRMLKEPRLKKLIAKQDKGVKSGGESVEGEIAEIRAALSSIYKTIVNAFEYYCLIANNQTRSAFSMGELSFQRFLVDCKLFDKKLTSEQCQSIFIAVNVESDKKSKESEANDDKCLMRMEFIEALIRMAIIKYKDDCEGDISDAVGMLVEKCLAPNIPEQGQLDCDIFRRERFYSAEVDAVLTSHMDVLELSYKKYKNFKPIAGTALFCIPQWLEFLSDCSLIGEDEAGDFTAREAMTSFFNSRMFVVDEIKSRNKYITLGFVDFLEAICRVADMVSIPTDSDVEAVGACNMLDYKRKVQSLALGSGGDAELARRLTERRKSSDFGVQSSRTLGEKLEKLISIIYGNIAANFNGKLSFEKTNINLIPRYCNEEQLVEQRSPK